MRPSPGAAAASTGMSRPRRWTTAFLVGGTVLAAGTPVYLGYAAPYLAGYLRHPTLLLGQLVPYALCAVLWLPPRSPDATSAGLLFSVLLFLAAAALYVPMLVAPGARGGDMIGLAFVAISAGTTAALLLGSAAAWLILRWRRRTMRERDPG